MKRKAFITGAAGFLGLNLIEELMKENWEITAFHFPSADLNYLKRFGVKMIGGNILDYAVLKEAIPEKTDALFHVAANTSAWSRNDKQQYKDNVEGTQNVISAALEKNVSRFIYTSSISAYGYHPGKTITESTESNALTCGMGYNRTKFLAENLVKKVSGNGLNAVILNPCNILGPYDRNNWARQFILPIFSGRLRAVPPGKAMWCSVKEIARAHIAAVDKGKPGENYLLGGTEARFIDIVNEIERQLGKPETRKVQSKAFLRILVPLMAAKSFFDGKEPILTREKYNRAAAVIRCDYSKAVRELNYQTAGLQEMVGDSILWLKSESFLG